MKAKFNITLPEVQAKGLEGSTVNFLSGGHVETEVEFTIAEARDLYELQKEIMKEAPELLKGFAVALCREFIEAKAKCTEELIKDEEFKSNYEYSQAKRKEFEEERIRLANKRRAQKVSE